MKPNFRNLTQRALRLFICLTLGSGAALSARRASGAGTETEFSKPIIDIGIVVSDANKTAQFLTNAIGCTELKGFSVTPERGKQIGLVNGYPVDVRVFALSEGDGTRLKVLSFPQAGAKKPDQEFIHSTLGFRYLTLYVKDMTAALARLKKAGVPTVGETPLDLGGGTMIAVVRDPDGNFVELIGPMKPKTP
jgi:catechol 2,3-dioxygenase-like lactoylglutathione lyase family enzyme